MALALFGIGFGAVHWSKSLMDGHDLVEDRHAGHPPAEKYEKREVPPRSSPPATRSRVSPAAS